MRKSGKKKSQKKTVQKTSFKPELGGGIQGETGKAGSLDLPFPFIV